MGAMFRLEHANIMAYVTSRSYGPPVFRNATCRSFRRVQHDARRWLIP